MAARVARRPLHLDVRPSLLLTTPPALAAPAPWRGLASYSAPRVPDPPPRGDRGPGESSAYGKPAAGGSAAAGPGSGASSSPSSDVDLRRRGEWAAALLSGMQADPSRVAAAVAQATAPSASSPSAVPAGLAALSGHGLASLLATAALTGTFDEALFRPGLSDGLLRSKTFDPADQALLWHVHVALRLRAPHLGRGLPPDVALACGAVAEAAALGLQRVYDPVALALRRMRVPLVYRSHEPGTGYLAWITLPGDAWPAGEADPYAARAPKKVSTGSGAAGGLSAGVVRSGPVMSAIPRMGARRAAAAVAGPAGPAGAAATLSGGGGRWVLEVDGPWSVIPGTAQPSLASRLAQANLEAAGVRTARITDPERQRLLGGAAAGSGEPRIVDVGGAGSNGEQPSQQHVPSDRAHADSLPALLMYILRDMRRA